MDTSKLTNGSRAEVLVKRSVPPPKSGQPNAERSEAKKVDKRATGKKAKTERPQVKAIRKSKSENLVCRYCGSDDLAPASSSDEIADAANVSVSAMDRRHGPEGRRSRSRLLKSKAGAGLERSSTLEHFQKDCFSYFLAYRGE
jgi:hypothetical protein